MAKLRAFKAIRPRKDLAKKVAALPYDVFNSSEAREVAGDNSYSFLHVDKAEIDLPEDTYIYDKKVYEKACENLNKMIEDKIFIQDEKPMLYIYTLIMDGKAQTGIVGTTSIDDYMNNIIKKHEFTREDKEKDRINHVDICDANTGPIFLTYKNNKEIENIINEYILKEPLYDFVEEDNVSHKIWAIKEEEIINKIIDLFNEIESLYIADGHHRAASAVKVGKLRRKQNPNYSGVEEFNYFLSVLFPDAQLRILDYNRVVKDLNGLTAMEFLNKLDDKFEVELKGEKSYKPEKNHSFGMYLDNKWYKITSKENTYDDNDAVLSLDVSILQNNLLEPILGIKDPRTDERIDFIGGIRGLDELKKRADSDMKLAFSMYPTTIDELMKIADNDKVMPPKSTWFEPKLRSGIFVHRLK
ncbi:MAG: DUF1015 domain-containing protein [Clostridiaceae bacterium]